MLRSSCGASKNECLVSRVFFFLRISAAPEGGASLFEPFSSVQRTVSCVGGPIRMSNKKQPGIAVA